MPEYAEQYHERIHDSGYSKTHDRTEKLFKVNEHEQIITSKELLLKQVISELNNINESLNTNYKLSRIYFSPFDSASSLVYHLLICKLIRHYHDGKKFTEV